MALKFICTVVTSWLDGRHVCCIRQNDSRRLSYPDVNRSSSELFWRAWMSCMPLVGVAQLIVEHRADMFVENTKKGANDKPTEDVIIAESGEVSRAPFPISILVSNHLPLASVGHRGG